MIHSINQISHYVDLKELHFQILIWLIYLVSVCWREARAPFPLLVIPSPLNFGINCLFCWSSDSSSLSLPASIFSSWLIVLLFLLHYLNFLNQLEIQAFFWRFSGSNQDLVHYLRNEVNSHWIGLHEWLNYSWYIFIF